MVAEKKLADAAGKIEAMETEMFALKSLLHNPDTSLDTSLSDVSLDKLHPSSHHKHHHKKHSVKKVSSCWDGLHLHLVVVPRATKPSVHAKYY